MSQGAAVTLEIVRDIGVLTFNNPPVNSLGHQVRKDLQKGIRECGSNPQIKAVVLIGGGKTFPAGADISEFPKLKKMIQSGVVPADAIGLADVIQEIEDLDKPVVAAIHGTALGGGLEVALGCHYRLALASAKVGLPEVQLGILPGAGGTQRLPRLVDMQTALKMITSGAPLKAPNAYKAGIIDFIVPNATTRDQLLEFAIQYAHETALQGIPLSSRRISHRQVLPVPPQMAFDMTKNMITKSARGFVAPLACVDAVEASARLPFKEGMAFEGETIGKLLMGPQSAAQQYFFFAQRMAGRVPGVKPVSFSMREVGIVGAGTMGAGIAMSFIEAGVKVVLLDVKADMLERADKMVRGNYASAVKKRRMTKEGLEKMLGLLTYSTDYNSFKDSDLVIEAVFENMEIKKKVLGALDKVCKPSALLCTNTSTLDVDEIAASTSRPEKVVGTHFFSPANKMKLLEIVRGSKTSSETLAQVLSLGKAIKKVSVVVGNCFGFVGNRMIEWYGREAAFLVEEGASPQQVDRVLYEFGMAMGPFAMGDLAGVDIGYKIRESLGLLDPSKRTDRYHGGLGDKLVALGRLGQKTGKGVYDYPKGSRKGVVSKEVEKLIDDHRRELGITPRSISDEEILERCLFPLINDGFNILQERIALRPSDIDVVYVYGYGFPVYRGGPMFYADHVGLPDLVAKMDEYAKRFPQSSHWKVSPMLRQLVGQGMSLQQFVKMMMSKM